MSGSKGDLCLWYMSNVREKNMKSIEKLAKFFGVGVVSTLFDWGLFAVALYLFKLPNAVAFTLAICGGAILNYEMNRRITFKKKRSSQSIISFIMIFAFVYGFSLVTFVFIGQWAPAILARIITTLIVFVINFISHKVFTFGVFARD